MSIKKIIIEIIPHKSQSYDTCGDYWLEADGTLQVRISDMRNWKYEANLILHELTEVFSVLSRGVKIEEIDEWDLSHPDSDDPGSEPGCPYYLDHKRGTIVEMFSCCEIFNLNWEQYDNEISKM